MKLLQKNHWLVKVNFAFSAAIFLYIFAALLRTAMASGYVSEALSIDLTLFAFAVVPASGFLSLMAAGIAMNFGFIVVSALYCLMTHDPDMHWLPRMIASAKILIDRPRWTADNGI
jgi:hypothetical protein